MKISVDYGRCEGHGQCVMTAPQIFELDDDEGLVVILQEEPAEELRGAAIAAVDRCPMTALHITK